MSPADRCEELEQQLATLREAFRQHSVDEDAIKARLKRAKEQQAKWETWCREERELVKHLRAELEKRDE